uniref:Uncharacterized protein n=1 Tax=Anguilla anguilla TaxID=7936 RepID=A0A0E9TMU2_ANGAN
MLSAELEFWKLVAVVFISFLQQVISGNYFFFKLNSGF